MANSNGWGDGAANNNVGWGQGANNAIGWGDSQKKSYAGLTDIVGITTDADAQQYFSRVTAAGGTLSALEQSAVNALVVQMKADGIWNAMKAVYPMVGASAAACAQNLKSSSFTGTFTSGWTFASTGVTGNGTSAFMNTDCNDNNFSTNLSSLGIYSRTNISVDTYDFGIYNSVANKGTWMRLRNIGFGGGVQQAPPEVNSTNSDSRGFYQMSKNGSTTVLSYKNSSQVYSTAAATTTPTNTTSFLASLNNSGTPAYGFSNKEFAFAFLGDGLSGTNMGNFYTAVQAFQTTLSRQV